MRASARSTYLHAFFKVRAAATRVAALNVRRELVLTKLRVLAKPRASLRRLHYQDTVLLSAALIAASVVE